MADKVSFFFLHQGIWLPAGEPHTLVYRLDDFMGCRIGLLCYATAKPGEARFFPTFSIM